MIRYLVFVLLIYLFFVSNANAHDIGVTKADLIEKANNQYQLKIQAGPSVAHLFGSPKLPEHCSFVDNPRGAVGANNIVWEFKCEGRALTADDVLNLPWRRDGALVTAQWLDGAKVTRLFQNTAGIIPVELAVLHAGSASFLDAATRYTSLGIEHILLGIDHLLFVLGLLLIVRGPWMLVKTITAFTVAHSVTLGLATLGFVHVPPRPVEAAIALSIVFLAVEIIHGRQGREGLAFRFPWVVAFSFGLLHGFGFAGALSDVGLPPQEIPIALLFFNIGVEVGQLVFVLAVIIVIWLFKKLKIPKMSMAEPVTAYSIGTLAMYWFLQRTGQIFT